MIKHSLKQTYRIENLSSFKGFDCLIVERGILKHMVDILKPEFRLCAEDRISSDHVKDFLSLCHSNLVLSLIGFLLVLWSNFNRSLIILASTCCFFVTSYLT